MQASPAPSPEGPVTDAGVAATAPLLAGPVEILWLLVLSILFIMTLVFVLLLRSRASQRAKFRKTETEFFKPAGDGAEITFDDAAARPAALEQAAVTTGRQRRGGFAGLLAWTDR